MKKVIFLILSSLVLFGCSTNKNVNENNIVVNTSEKSSILNNTVLKEKFMKENKVVLTSDDVKYDMENNLDQLFFLEGTAKLSAYYNYGYLNESKAFSVEITYLDKSDKWHVYFDRDVFGDLFEHIKKHPNSEIYVSALIPKIIYKRGQGNMAYAQAASWD